VSSKASAAADNMQVAIKTYGEGFSSGFARFQHSQEFWDVSVPPQCRRHRLWGSFANPVSIMVVELSTTPHSGVQHCSFCSLMFQCLQHLMHVLHTLNHPVETSF
jgi:hypothetical protein